MRQQSKLPPLPLAPVARILKKGSGLRISQDAIEEMVYLLEEFALAVSHRAGQLARHSGRKTLTGKDLKMARV